MDHDDLADQSFDRYARMVRRALGVPVALVSIVEENRQVFPGAEGLPVPYQQSRETPLSHSFCQYVVKDERPLIVPDARIDRRLSTNLAIEDLSVVAYAGWPLQDHLGRTVGSLCAIDSEPREWTVDELASLEDLAAACSAELAQRELSAAAAAQTREVEALLSRGRSLLALSETLAATITLASIAEAVEDVAVRELGCVRAGVWLSQGPGRGMGFVATSRVSWPRALEYAVLPADAGNPIGDVFIERRPLFFHDHHEQNARHRGVTTSAEVGEGRAFLPLLVGGEALGTLTLIWSDRRYFFDEVRGTVVALASYTAQAVQRALLLQERVDSSITLQRAMLTELPTRADHELVARYRPAAAREQVGGDWYDALTLPTGALGLVIGDVVGHDIAAAAAMGQARNALRALAWSRQDGPAETLSRLDRTMGALAPDLMATLTYAVVEDSSVTYSCAGHPPPLVVGPDGRASFLDTVPNLPLGVDPRVHRVEQRHDVTPGSTIVLYTDGLVERRGEDLMTGLERFRRAAEDCVTDSLDQFLDGLLDALLPERLTDDVAVIAVRSS